MNERTTIPAPKKATLSPLRHSACFTCAGLLACASLVFCGLDGLMSGHVHVQDGSTLHHRHLFAGAHQHDGEDDQHAADESGRLATETADPVEDHHGSEKEAPESSKSTISTLELTNSLQAETLSGSLLAALPLVALRVEVRRSAAPTRFYLTEGPRPPPQARPG